MMIREGLDRLNIIGALLVLPNGKQFKLSLRSYGHSLTGKETIEFLKQLLRCTSGYIILVSKISRVVVGQIIQVLSPLKSSHSE